MANYLKYFAALTLCLLFFCVSVSAGERQATFRTGKLANGIRVAVEEDRGSSVFALQAWIRAGSKNESENQAGLAHLLEHMLFRRVMPPGSELGRLAEQVESAGGDINAYTSPDCTVVHLVLPGEAAESGIRAIASVFSRPEFDPRELEEEKKVVIEEINRSEDLPEGLLMKRLFAEAFWVHPYGRPVIGDRESVGRFTVQDLQSFFLQYYRPENIVISAAGNVSGQKLIQGLEREFRAQGLRSKTRAASPPAAVEPAQEGFRSRVLRGRWNKAYLAMAFHVGGVNDRQIAAIDLLANILGEGTDSRLRRELEERRRLVYSISASSYTPAEPGLIIIQAELEPGNVSAAILAIQKEIASLRRVEIRPEELKRAQSQITSEYLRAGESREGRAGQLGFVCTLTPGINYEKTYLRKIAQTTVGDIRQAAGRYLRPGNLTVAVLVPEKSLPGFSEADLDAELAGCLRGQSDGDGGAERTAVGKVTEQNDSGTKVLFPNGLRLVIREKPGSGTVAIVAAFRGGLLAEPPGQEGISNLFAELLTRGTSRHGFLGIAEKTKSLGGEIEAFSGLQSLGLKSEFLASDWLPGMELVAEIVQSPAFPDNESDKLKEKIVAAIKSRDENLMQLAFLRLRGALYGEKSYGHDILGTTASVPLISRADLRDFQRAVIRPENLVISVVGDIKSREVIVLAAGLWGGWEPEEVQSSRFKAQGKTDRIQDLNNPDERQKSREFRFPVPGARQVNMVWGFPGTTFFSPDRFPLEVLDAVLSGQSGQLFRNIRDREGLAYMIGSSNIIGLEPGFFSVYLATSPEREGEAVKAVNSELSSLIEKGVSEEELTRAKTYLIGNFEASRQTTPAIALNMALDEIYGLGFAYADTYVRNVREVDIGRLKASILKYLDRQSAVMIKIGAVGE